MRPRLTKSEYRVLLTAANLYEAEPANFEDDKNDTRHKTLLRAIEKLHAILGP
jgi:hypothetical protein